MRNVDHMMLALLAGILLVVLLPVRFAPLWLMIAVLLPLIVLGPPTYRLGWLALGVIVALIAHALSLSARPAIESAEPVRVIGTVVGLPETMPGRVRFTLRPDQWLSADATPYHSVKRIRVSVYGESLPVAAGEQWAFSLRLRRPRGFKNPVGFDYEQWLAANHFDALAYVTEPASAQRLSGPAGISHWRAVISAKIAALAGAEEQGAALLKGLVAGDRRDFSDSTWEILRATGTSHLMAISGLHIGLAAGFGFFLGGVIWRFLRLPGPKRLTAIVIASVMASVYAAMAGFALPTQRALVMFFVAAIGALMARRAGGQRALLIAACVLLIIDPAAALSAGFWLSFAAVFLIFLISQQARQTGAVKGLIRIQLLLTVGLAPISAIFFSQWSPLGLPVNLLILPVFSLLIVPTALVGAIAAFLAPPIGEWLLSALATLLSGLLDGGAWLQSITTGPLSTGSVNGTVLLLACIAGLLLLMPRGTPLRALSIPFLLPLLGSSLSAHPNAAFLDDSVRITWLEVGQGNAAVIQAGEAVMVIDTGPSWGGGANAAAFSLVPFLSSQGISHIDHLVITHADRDHRGGVEALLDEFSFGEVWVGEPVDALPNGQLCQAGEGFTVGRADIRMLWPDKPGVHTGNKASCVLMLTAHGHRLLFTGDITEAVERRLATKLGGPVDVMEAPHHGSKTSTSQSILQAARPQHVVISAGYRNAYSMPHSEVIRRIRCQGALVHDLGLEGALQIELRAGKALGYRRERAASARLLNEPLGLGRFRDGREIHYHQRFIATSPMETGQPTCGS